MKRIFFFLIVAILISSCSEIRDDFDLDTNVTATRGDDFVSERKASEVANKFFLTVSNNKNNIANSIKTIKDKDSDTPTMYVINYKDGGFVIVSATKKYYPILAYSEKNSLAIETINESLNQGVFIWSENVKNRIKELKTKSFDENTSSIINNSWALYEELDSKESNKTKGFYEDEMAFRQRLSELYSKYPSFSFSPLSSAANFLPSTEYQNLCNIANMYGSSLQHTIIGYKSKPTQEVGPLINTIWHQGSPYNGMCPNKYPAGCVAIAMAQIMKFYKHPTKYNWNNMPNYTGTVDTQTLIANIGTSVEMEYGSNGSGADYENTIIGFQSMGYNTVPSNPLVPLGYKHTDVENYLLNKKQPVFMSGFRTKEWLGLIYKDGHAWVIEGAKSKELTLTYFVEYKTANGYSSLGGPTGDNPASSSGHGYLYFYINWGWGANEGNGWFNFDNFNSQNGNYQYKQQVIYVAPK
ncbi:C10 family peptidase [uncultured Dysgonomonas sp.]|uniref:C10 family peptidase n=1 Tax=uncultured Dysgonomonas sp. TaxID=206096 RepID=UPI0028055501|nr:C10 family peptidase [uncultured Dysgonomonas sp.]